MNMFRPGGEKVERRRILPAAPGMTRLHRGENWSRPPIHMVDYPRAVSDAALYPERYEELEAALVTHHGLPSREWIVLGNGIEEFVRTEMMIHSGRRAMWAEPNWRMYGVYGEMLSHYTARLALIPGLSPPAAFALVAGRVAKFCPAVFFWANPAQPFEVCLSESDLRELLWTCNSVGTFLVVDEAYAGFGAQSAIPLTADSYDLIVLRSFSKAAGGAGLRVGYAVGHPRALAPLKALRLSNELAAHSVDAALILLDRWNHEVAEGIRLVVEGRDWLLAALKDAGFVAYGGKTNRVLVEVTDREAALAHLLRHGFIVGATGPSPRHPNQYLLITAQSVDVMRGLWQALPDALMVKREKVEG